jgi:predicted permease
VTARLKPGITSEQAQAEMTAIAKRLAHDNPTSNEGRGFKVVPYPKNAMEGIGANLAWLVLALSGMVLLIVCANLANLHLVRMMSRTHEIGVRIALGCPQSTLIRLLLAESLVVSLLGGALGLLVAKWSNSYVANFYGVDMPLDLRVIGFTFLISLVVGTAFGIVPAWIASRTDVSATLKAGGRGTTTDRSRHWIRQGLVTVELSLALLLLTAAGFFVVGIYRLTHRDLGWDAPQTIVGFLALDHDHYGEQRDARSLVFGENLVRRLQSVPGVESVAISSGAPAWGFNQVPFRPEGQPAPERGKEIFAGRSESTSDFLKTYGIQLVSGRNFTEADRPGSPKVVIVNQALAAKFWPGEDPIGKRVGETDPAKPDWAVVVGVMRDFKGAAEFFDPAASSYKILQPWAQNTHRFINFHVRMATNAEGSIELIRKVVAELAPDVALSQLATVPQVLTGEMSYFTFLRRLLLQISVLGLLLAGVGTYGVIASLASERRLEVGIRMALGAQPNDVRWLFLKNGLQLALIGSAIGTVLSLWVLSILAKTLPMVPGRSLWLVLSVAGFLIAIAGLASWLPARRSTQVDPTVALRGE